MYTHKHPHHHHQQKEIDSLRRFLHFKGDIPFFLMLHTKSASQELHDDNSNDDDTISLFNTSLCLCSFYSLGLPLLSVRINN